MFRLKSGVPKKTYSKERRGGNSENWQTGIPALAQSLAQPRNNLKKFSIDPLHRYLLVSL